MSRNYYFLGTAIILLVAFLLVIFSTNRNTGSDPRATLLVTESILKQGTIQLDNYGPETLRKYGAAIRQKNGHAYNFFPIGTAIASIPFVALTNVFGFKMVESEPVIQIWIAGFTAILTLFFFIQLASFFLPPLSALTISGVFWFGTTLASTCGTALWSHNFATLFALLAIYSSLKMVRESVSGHWFLISAFLFFAYLCRPTMVLLAPFLLLFIFTYNKSAAIKSALLLLALLAGFMGWSFHEYKQVLPDYYMPTRLSGEQFSQYTPAYSRQLAGGHFLEAFYGNLLSPARGLLIFSPFLLFAWLGFKKSANLFDLKSSWLLIGLLWPLAHLLVISRFPHWWAGYSFGPRLTTDMLPGLFLLTVRTWPQVFRNVRDIVSLGLLIISCIFAVYINSYQGLNNPYTMLWNIKPDIDYHPELVFDWKYPQFLYTRQKYETRMIQNDIKSLHTISPAEVFLHTSDKVLFVGWSDAELTHRWSSGKSSRIVFFLDDQKKRGFRGTLFINAGSFGKQRMNICLNDHRFYSGELNTLNASLQVPFDPSFLIEGENNLRFDLPDAQKPGTDDPRVLALALKSFSLQ